MPVSQLDIDALNAALAGGERVVRTADGKMVEYRSVAEIIRARDDLTTRKAAEDALSAGQPRPRHTRLVQGGRGFD